MEKIIFLTNTDSYYAMLKKSLQSLTDREDVPALGEAYWVSGDGLWNEEWQGKFVHCDAAVIEWMGVSLEEPFLQGAHDFFRKKGICFKIKAGDDAEGNAAEGFDPADHVMVGKYSAYGGIENFKNLWLWLFHRFGGAACGYDEPAPMLWNGIYHPAADRVYTDLAAYKADFCRNDYKTLGLLFYRNEWLADNLAYQQAIIAAGARKKINVIAVFSHGVKNPEMGAPGLDDAIRRYFMDDGKACIDVLINTIKFSLTASGSIEASLLKELNVPFLQAYTLMNETEIWRENIQGMNAVEVAISITMPEFDGIVHSVPIAGKYRDKDNIIFYRPIQERIDVLLDKASKWAALRHKPNHAKKVAIIFHNYPPTNSNIGTALGMDSPESVRLLLAALQRSGYMVDAIPGDSKTLMEEITACATNDRRFMTEKQIEHAIGRVRKDDYQKLFDRLSESVRAKMIEAWGEPPGEVFNYDDALLVPGISKGNIIITVQPPRGFGEDSGKIYHDPVAPPTHHYLAFYYWLREIWQADAVIHVGTHGSVEWLPGKAAGLSADCYSDICLGDLPNLYHYIVTVIGEGIQAKRRSAACLVDYLTPPMRTSGLYDEMAELELLLDEYLDFKDNEPDKLGSAATLIREKAMAAHLDKEISEDSDFGAYVGALHRYLTDIKNMQIRVGLHILGIAPGGEELMEYLLALTRMENGKVPSLCRVLAARYGYDYDELMENSACSAAVLGITYGKLVDKIREESKAVIAQLMQRQFDESAAADILNFADYGEMERKQQGDLVAVCRYICTVLAPGLAETTAEMTNTLRGLAGEFIEPSVAGAPTNGRADVLPTGRNFYGVDPQTLPTKIAWEIGKKKADGVIAQYIMDEGRYPETIGMVMGSDMRTHGETFAQFMYLLGIRPIWQKGNGRVVDLEVMPMAELQRPRIDALARITGMMRDSMPCVVVWLDKAVKLAATVTEDEDCNYVRKHVLADTQELIDGQGLTQEAAWKQAGHRLFGCPPGGYGAGVAYLLEEKNWENVDDLAQVYVRWGAHVYGDGESGAYLPDLFKRRLSQVDATIMGIDNREINLLSADDFNSYHGGLIAGVRSFSGKMPRAYCADSTDRNHVVVRTITAEVKRVFRGEIMNPKFIEGMKKHGYKGAADMGNYVAHCYQWDATSEVMDDWMYENLAEKYALDTATQQWMQEVNPWALQRIAAVLLEAEQRGMWQAKPKTKAALQGLFLSMEGELEERSDEN